MLPNVKIKSMFGAYGLYSAGKFFGILDEGRLYFKTDAQSQVEYTVRGMGPFTYEMRGQVRIMAYHEVPTEVLEQPQELIIWARRAVEIATKSPGKRPKSKRNPLN
jgi:DNA transformation protein